MCIRDRFHTGQCHLLMGKAALARRCFGIVAERSRDERLARKAQSYLDGLDEVGAEAACASVENDH